jgi:hypothetical protein
MTVTFDRSLHRYCDEHGTAYPSVTELLANSGIVDFSVVKQDIRERSLKRGTSVHWLCQLYDEGALNSRTVPLALRGYYKAWKVWRERSEFSPILIERPFISPYGYAGTPDRYGDFPNKTFAVVDLKTGEGAVADWVRYQLAAYAHFFGSVQYRTVRRVGVKLHADGTYNAREFPVQQFNYDLSVFHQALRQWRTNAADNRQTTGTGAQV